MLVGLRRAISAAMLALSQNYHKPMISDRACKTGLGSFSESTAD
jgi:hypothetical protein